MRSANRCGSCPRHAKQTKHAARFCVLVTFDVAAPIGISFDEETRTAARPKARKADPANSSCNHHHAIAAPQAPIPPMRHLCTAADAYERGIAAARKRTSPERKLHFTSWRNGVRPASARDSLFHRRRRRKSRRGARTQGKNDRPQALTTARGPLPGRSRLRRPGRRLTGRARSC